MRILFLDLDEVLNSPTDERASRTTRQLWLHPGDKQLKAQVTVEQPQKLGVQTR